MGLSISQPDRGHFHPRPLCSSEQKQPLGDTVLALLDEVQCVGVWYIWEHLWPRHLTERVLRWDTLIGAGLIHCREQIPTDCGPRILLRSRPGVLWALDACQLLLLHTQTPLFVMSHWLLEQAMCNCVFVWERDTQIIGWNEWIEKYNSLCFKVTVSPGMWILLSFC